MRGSRVLDQMTRWIEQAEALDRPAELLAKVVRTAVRPGPVEDVLSGTPVGHPLHPVLVAVPIGAWVSANVLDVAGEPDAARKLVGLGLLTAVPTAASGGSDWLSTDGPEQRVGLVHAVLNYAGIGVYAASWVSRRHGRQARGVAWSLVGMGLLGASGYLGGHLAYARGVGVDTTAFQHLPTEWTDAGPLADVPEDGSLLGIEVEGIPVLVARHAGQVVVLDDRCTHRGAPLHEGTVSDGCVTCPWHDSVFSLADGGVESGPATRPQPKFETRVQGDRLQIRHPHATSLQTNPVGT